MSKAFADKSLKEQEPVLLHYIDLLIQRLVQKCEEGRAALNAVDWYNVSKSVLSILKILSTCAVHNL